MIFLRALILLITANYLLPFNPCFASDEAERDRDRDRSARLYLLQQATGNPSAASASGNASFAARVDSMLNRTAEPQRAYVAKEYPETVGPVAANILLESTLPKLTTDKKKDPEEKVKAMKDPIKDALKIDDRKLQTDELSYQRMLRENMEKDRLLEKQKQELAESQKKATQAGEEHSARSHLRPSLANNPFYFGEETEESFESNKNIMISRLVQEGYTRLEAQSVIGNSNSSEEVILSLMQHEGFEYGRAIQVVGTNSARKTPTMSDLDTRLPEHLEELPVETEPAPAE